MMKNLFMKAAAGLLLFVSSYSYAGNNYWKTFNGKEVPTSAPTAISAKNYSLFSLDQNTMRSFLFGLSGNYDQAQPIQLPTPDKKYMNFHIWKTSAMEKGLADRYPDIQTFTAVCDEDPNITAKLEYTLLGFTAMIYNSDKTYYINPINQAGEGYYTAFYKSDYISHMPTGVCGVKNDGTEAPLGAEDHTTGTNANGTRQGKQNGTHRHYYRLALSCTAEYAIAAGNTFGISNPTVAQILSIMVSSVNKIDGYYEREFSVHMDLIQNNDAIIYVDTASDPYTCDQNTNCLIGQSNTNIGSVIGTANFDIGHTLCTAGGGLAQLYSVCGQGGKASAVSFSDGLNVSVVLHEMGHQFGANHTFNSNSGGCNGNGNQNTAYEPGAGISTMSYSGVCDPDNVGGRIDDYFHVNTLMEVSSFLLGQGSSCGADTLSTVTQVSLPVISEHYYIPKNTPFELTAPQVDPSRSGESITYNWEQWDLGNFQGAEATEATQASGPLFRSYTPIAGKVRPYPEYFNVMNGAYGDGAAGVGARLAKVSRPINFKLSVRSVFQGWGSFALMDDTVNIITDAISNAFRVTSQATAETWNPGSTKTITWNVAGSNADSVKCGYVSVYLSKDSGVTFPYLIIGNAPNTGTYTFTVPNGYAKNAFIKVKGSGSIFFDINKAPILLNGDPTAVNNITMANDITIYPNPATSSINIVNKTVGSNTLKVVMYNAVGQQVWKGTLLAQTQIETSAFARGTYMIQVINEQTGERNTEKVILR
jgi:hypothetical protein